MKASLSHHVERAKRRLMSLSLLALGLPSLAFGQQSGLPSLEEPSQTGDGGFMGFIQGYLYDGAILGGLVLAVIALMVVANAAIGAFNEARKRGEWFNFGTIVVVGIVLIVAIIWLVTKAGPILSQ